MNHLSPSELMRCASDETVDERASRHLPTCVACAADVAGLRTALAALRVGALVRSASTPGCLDDATVAALVDGVLPPAVCEAHAIHLADCARCRAAVSSLARVVASDRVAGELAALHDEPGRHAWRRYLVPVGVAASALLLLVLEQPSRPDEAPHRERPVTTAPAPVTIAPLGEATDARALRWHPVEGADRYRVTLFDADGNVLHEAILTDTVAAVPQDVELEAGGRYFWIVAARTGLGREVASEIAEFSLPAGAGR